MKCLVLIATMGTLFMARPAAAAAPDTPSPDARRSFDRGYELAQRGDLDGAIAAFEEAYRSSPHFSVLYNLAQAYANSSRVVEAVDTFERYLSQGGSAVPATRAAQVREAIAYYAQRIGLLELRIEPAGATVSLDGVPVGTSPLPSPLRVGSGKHVVLVSAPHRRPRVATVEIHGQQKHELDIDLPHEPAAALVITCSLPDVAIRLDESAVAIRAGTPHPLSPGVHSLVLSREGYVPQRISFEVVSGQRLQLTCDLPRDVRFVRVGRLSIRHPTDTKLLLDGRPHDDVPVPEGRHQLVVSGIDYETKSEVIEVQAGESRIVDVHPTRTGRWFSAALERRAHARRTVAYVVGGAGLAAVSTAIALYVSDNAARNEWSNKSASLTRRLQQDPSSVTATQLDELIEEENHIRARDSAALATGIGGVLALAASATLLLWADAPKGSSVSADARRITLRVRF